MYNCLNQYRRTFCNLSHTNIYNFLCNLVCTKVLTKAQNNKFDISNLMEKSIMFTAITQVHWVDIKTKTHEALL